MANTLTGLIPVIYEALNIVSREMVGFIPAVSMDSKAESAAVNQTVRSPIAPAATLEDITPGVSPADSGDQAMDYVDVTITKSKASPIRWTGEEQLSVGGNLNPIMVDQMVQSMRALTNAVESDLGATYIAACRAHGTAGTTPFGTSGNFTDFAGVNKILDENGSPTTNRQLVLGSAAIGNIRGVQSGLFEANRAGNDELLRRGIVGMVEGLDIHQSAGVKTHTKGTGALYAVDLVAGYAIGDTAVHVDTGTGTLLAGDIVTFAGDTNKYVTTTGFAGDGDMDLVLSGPGLRQTLANDVAMTLGANYVANMAFVRSAIQLAARFPAMPKDAAGNNLDSADDVLNITDPVSGLTFQLAVYRQYRRVKYELGLAWGVKVVKPADCCILLG